MMNLRRCTRISTVATIVLLAIIAHPQSTDEFHEEIQQAKEKGLALSKFLDSKIKRISSVFDDGSTIESEALEELSVVRYASGTTGRESVLIYDAVQDTVTLEGEDILESVTLPHMPTESSLFGLASAFCE